MLVSMLMLRRAATAFLLQPSPLHSRPQAVGRAAAAAAAAPTWAGPSSSGSGSSRIRGGRDVRLFSGGTTATGGGAVDVLKEAIAAKGEEIRGLKTSGADKAALQPLIDQLLGLKASCRFKCAS